MRLILSNYGHRLLHHELMEVAGTPRDPSANGPSGITVHAIPVGGGPITITLWLRWT